MERAQISTAAVAAATTSGSNNSSSTQGCFIINKNKNMKRKRHRLFCKQERTYSNSSRKTARAQSTIATVLACFVGSIPKKAHEKKHQQREKSARTANTSQNTVCIQLRTSFVLPNWYARARLPNQGPKLRLPPKVHSRPPEGNRKQDGGGTVDRSPGGREEFDSLPWSPPPFSLPVTTNGRPITAA